LETEALPPFYFLKLIFLIPMGLLMFAAAICMIGAVIHAVAEQYFHQPISIGWAYSLAWRRLRAMFGAVLLVYLAIIGIYLAIILIGVLLSLAFRASSDWTMALALITMIPIAIPAMYYLGIKWNFIVQTAQLEACGSRAALSRSWTLVKGSWWRVLGIFLLLYLIMYAIIWILSMICYIPALIAVFASSTSAFTPYGAPEFTIWIMVGAVICMAIGGIISLPIFVIGQTLLYFDLRVRKQGYNVEKLAGELGLPTTAADSAASPPQ
jgi:hypothetical protein